MQSPAVLRRIVLSFDALAADVYWIRALQHYGDRLSRDGRERYRLLYPLLDLTTSLDPISRSRRFGAIFLSEGYPGGPGRPDLAVALLKKGIAAQPDNWRYYHDIAFVHYWQFHDTKTAAEWFRLAQKQPGAPGWLEPVAASMLIEGGDRQSARFILQQLSTREGPGCGRWRSGRCCSSTRSTSSIATWVRHDRAKSAAAGHALFWQWLIGRGALPGIPFDPTSVPFEIDPATAPSACRRGRSCFRCLGLDRRNDR